MIVYLPGKHHLDASLPASSVRCSGSHSDVACAGELTCPAAARQPWLPAHWQHAAHCLQHDCLADDLLALLGHPLEPLRLALWALPVPAGIRASMMGNILRHQS